MKFSEMFPPGHIEMPKDPQGWEAIFALQSLIHHHPQYEHFKDCIDEPRKEFSVRDWTGKFLQYIGAPPIDCPDSLNVEDYWQQVFVSPDEIN